MDDTFNALEFLQKLVREFNLQDMSEAQAFRVLTDLLDEIARQVLRPVSETTSPGQRGITAWPRDPQWLLRSIATNDSIHNAVHQLCDVIERPNKDEKYFYASDRQFKQFW